MARAFDPDAVLSLPLMAHLATASPDGPRTTPVWFLWDDTAMWMLGDAGGSSVRRLRDDARCAVDVVHFDNEAGVLLHLGLRGRAEIVKQVGAQFRRLLAKYLGPDEATWNRWFIDTVAQIDAPSTRMIRLAPETVFTNNVSYFRTGPELAWPPVLNGKS